MGVSAKLHVVVLAIQGVWVCVCVGGGGVADLFAGRSLCCLGLRLFIFGTAFTVHSVRNFSFLDFVSIAELRGS